MILTERIDLLCILADYILSNNPAWVETRDKASKENAWFIPEFIDLATGNIARIFLQKDILEKWVAEYSLPSENPHPKKVGIVMAGNIPLVGFHDFLCTFISGHISVIKPSAKDDILIRHLIEKMSEWNSEVKDVVEYSSGMLKNCDAYIATGSNNSAGYFEYYFKKYPHIIRRNRTSVAILTGKESREELENLADDVYLYFGRGCRNVTKVNIPVNYDFIPLLKAFEKYNHFAGYNKYKNNYDYNLAIHILNKKVYMSNASILLVEESSPFSPISQLNYEFYTREDELAVSLKNNSDIQCIVGKKYISFGQSQYPSIRDYADSVDTLQFLTRL